MIDIFDEASLKFIGYLPKERFTKKSLLFQGFISLESIKLRSSYAYIMTNRLIENKIWVYPIRLSDNYNNYKTMKKGKYLSYTEVFGKVGIPGITKIRYSNER